VRPGQGAGIGSVVVSPLPRAWAEDVIREWEFVIMVIATSNTCRSDVETLRIRRRSSYLETPQVLVTKPGIVRAAACNDSTLGYIRSPLDEVVIP
jgi:hypothetical protein